MQMLLSRLADEDDASHLLEYSLLAAGVAAAISEPYLFVAAVLPVRRRRRAPRLPGKPILLVAGSSSRPRSLV